MNICFVSQEYPDETGWGGIGTYTYEMAHGLARLGHKVVVLSRAVRQASVYQEADGVTVYRILPYFNLGKMPLLWRLNRLWEGYHLAVAIGLRRIIREHRIDLVEVPALHGETLFFQYWQPEFPVVVRIHSCMPRNLALNNIPKRLPLRKSHWCERQAVALTHHLTAPSQAIVRDNLPHLRIANLEQVKVIANPIDTNLFCPAENGGQDSDAPVLFVGRLEQLKGAHILGQAIPLVLQQMPNTKFSFVGRDGQAPGGGPMSDWILKQVPANKHTQVSFIKHIPRQDVVKLYQQARVVAFPSFWEAFGYIATEALACGKPVIATRSGGPEEIIDQEQTGFLVPRNDPAALAAEIIRVLSDVSLRRRVGAAAREKAVSVFNTPVISRQMADYYQAVIETS